MKYIIVIFISLLICSCKKCPEQRECPACPPVNDCSGRLTVEQMDSIYDIQLERLQLVHEDNLALLDSLHTLALAEVDIYRAEAEYQVDTMRANFMNWRDSTLVALYAWEDSIQRLHFHDNTTINCDTLHNVEVYFDEETGKPVLRILE